MLKLNKDVLILILEELQDDKNSLYSCLLVNKTLCESIVFILWKNPWRYLSSGREEPLFNVIMSHLPDESKNRLISQGINLSNTYRRPLFNYISFCRNLNLCDLSQIIYTSNIREYSKRMIVKEEFLKLFINKNTKFTSLSLPENFNDQIHLIPGAERCFSSLEYLYCCTSTNQHILDGLAMISNSIRRLEFNVAPSHYNFGIVNLIKYQKNLNQVVGCLGAKNDTFCKALEESLIDHAGTLQHLKLGWEPITNILSSLVNLISLEINRLHNTNWDNITNARLPFLKILRTQNIPPKVLTNLIDNTQGHLLEVSVQYPMYDRYDREHKYDGENSNVLIRSIVKKCLNIKYLRLSIRNDDIPDLERLLTSCVHLDGLILNSPSREDLEWEKLFDILVRLAPSSLYKFKFIFNGDVPPEIFKTFFHHWRGRPMLLKMFYRMTITQDHSNVFNEYHQRLRKIKMFSHDPAEFSFDEFEWNFRMGVN